MDVKSNDTTIKPSNGNGGGIPLGPNGGPVVITDFAWHHIPDCYLLPPYHTLGTCSVNPSTGRCEYRVQTEEQHHLLASGRVWATYAAQALSVGPEIDALSALRVQWAQLQAFRPFTRRMCSEVLTGYNDKYYLNCYVDADFDESSVASEEHAFLLGGLVTAGGHLPLMAEKGDLITTLKFLYETMCVQGHSFTEFLQSPSALLAFISELHKRLMASAATTRGFTAGQFRRENVCLTTAHFCTPQHLEVPALMQQYAQWAVEATRSLDPVVFAAELHCRLVYIHPFDDGNGRVARMLLNLALTAAHYPPVVLGKADKTTYSNVLTGAFWGRREAYYKFIAHLLEQSFQIYSDVLPSAPPPSSMEDTNSNPPDITRLSVNDGPNTSSTASSTPSDRQPSISETSSMGPSSSPSQAAPCSPLGTIPSTLSATLCSPYSAHIHPNEGEMGGPTLSPTNSQPSVASSPMAVNTSATASSVEANKPRPPVLTSLRTALPFSGVPLPFGGVGHPTSPSQTLDPSMLMTGNGVMGMRTSPTAAAAAAFSAASSSSGVGSGTLFMRPPVARTSPFLNSPPTMMTSSVSNTRPPLSPPLRAGNPFEMASNPMLIPPRRSSPITISGGGVAGSYEATRSPPFDPMRPKVCLKRRMSMLSMTSHGTSPLLKEQALGLGHDSPVLNASFNSTAGVLEPASALSNSPQSVLDAPLMEYEYGVEVTQPGAPVDWAELGLFPPTSTNSGIVLERTTSELARTHDLDMSDLVSMTSNMSIDMLEHSPANKPSKAILLHHHHHHVAHPSTSPPQGAAASSASVAVPRRSSGPSAPPISPTHYRTTEVKALSLDLGEAPHLDAATFRTKFDAVAL